MSMRHTKKAMLALCKLHRRPEAEDLKEWENPLVKKHRVGWKGTQSTVCMGSFGGECLGESLEGELCRTGWCSILWALDVHMQQFLSPLECTHLLLKWLCSVLWPASSKSYSLCELDCNIFSLERNITFSRMSPIPGEVEQFWCDCTSLFSEEKDQKFSSRCTGPLLWRLLEM